MSIKIWEAWRVPLSRLEEATDWIHDYMWDKAKDHYMKIYDSIIPPDSENEKPAGTMVRHMKIDRIMRVTRKDGTLERTNLSFECGFTFWILEGKVYMIPYGRHAFIPGDDDIPDWFEDYHYQNQVDRPENITEEEYEERRHTWERMNLGEGKADWFPRMYIHSVIENGEDTYHGMAIEAMKLFDKRGEE